MRRLRLRLRGQVQGVGLRPWLAREARARGLSGAVWNDADGVGVEIQGAQGDLDGLLAALEAAPAPIRVRGLTIEPRPPISERGFQIRESQLVGPPRPALAPDQAMCDACASEVLDPCNRRYRYAFTTCAACGPRYALVEALPFDRARTGMSGFPMCATCAAEHEDPADRRYHAVTLSCPACGPRLRWQGPDATVTYGYTSILAAVEALRAGRIVAVLGLGGYQLLCDARSEAAVARLRQRKRRPDKPLALLVREAEAEALAHLEPGAREIWSGPIAPIVVAPVAEGAELAPSVLRGLGEVGLMRPTTPLHLLLAEAFGGPLVCTSGNRAGDPLATTPAQAREAMGEVPDGWLEHDRPVTHPIDDSVLRARDGRRIWLRRARGLAPSELAVPEGPTVLALGAHLKSTVTLAHRDGAWLSPSLGELGSERAEARSREAALELCRWHGVRPELVACDAHPDYASTRLAEAMAAELGVPLVRVQHHHAHAAAVLAEAGHHGPAGALCWDGAGWGPDGTVWGGEWLELEPGRAARRGRLRPFALPGGDRAAREPVRVSLSLLHTLQDNFQDSELVSHLDRVRRSLGPGRADALRAALAAGVGTPQTSSMGRLFDGLAHLLGGPPVTTWEAQAACWLEQVAGEADPPPLPPPAPRARDGIVELDWAPWLRALLGANADRAKLAAAVHVGLARGAALMLQCSKSPGVVALAGGCFQNARLLHEATTALSSAGITTLHARDLPSNDEAISFGQAVIARQRADG